MSNRPVEQITAEAFSRTAAQYDRFGENHPHLARMRARVYQHLEAVLPAGARILELNSGTGIDAIALVERGFRVHATDISEGMLARLQHKAERLSPGPALTHQFCSFLDLDLVSGGPYDSVFSDMGGLNCTADLSQVIAKLPHVLKPGGIVTWVIMPPICLWELALLFTGRFGQATRRLRPGGTSAHLEGVFFPVNYYTPRQVIQMFGPQYRVLRLEGLSVITPTSGSVNLYKTHPQVYRTLAALDNVLSPRWPWYGWGDFFILSMQYIPTA